MSEMPVAVQEREGDRLMMASIPDSGQGGKAPGKVKEAP